MAKEPVAAGAPRGAPRRKVFYGWYIVGAGFISTFLSNTSVTIGLSAYIPLLREELGWSVAAISLGFSIKQFEQGMMGPVGGYLIDRFGPRRMATVGIIIMTLGLILFSRMSSLPTFYLASVVIALGQSLGATQGYSASIVHWFKRRRGRATSILQTGFAVGYVGVYPLTLLLATIGWRSTAVVVAVIYCVICLPLAQMIRHKPQPYGFLPDGDSAASGGLGSGSAGIAKETEGSFTVKQALRSRTFWMLMLARAFYGLTSSVHHVHEVPHLINRGFSTKGAGLFIAVYGLTQIVGRLAGGVIGDRIGRVLVFRSAFVLLGVGWLFFAFVSPQAPWITAMFYLTFGVGHAAHQLSQAVVADFFGPGRYATIHGMMGPMSLAISVMGPLYGGLMFDWLGSYQRAFLIMGPIIALGSVLISLAGTPTLSGQEALAKKTAGSGSAEGQEKKR